MKQFIKDKSQQIPETVDQMTDIIDIEGVFIYPWLDWLYYAVIAFFFLLVLLALYKLYQKVRKNRLHDDELPPEKQFLDDLKKLKMQDFAGKGEEKKLYFFLSESVRRFIHRYYQYDAIDKTFDEISCEFISKNIASESDTILRFLQKAEQVKFAGIKPGVDEIDRDFLNLESWVKKQGIEDTK